MYVREPHAGQKSFADVQQPTTYGERCRLAGDTRQELKARIPLIIDEMNNATRAAYGNLPNCAYLIGTDGRVFFKQAWTNATTLEPAITSLLKAGGAGGANPQTIKDASIQAPRYFGKSKSGRLLLRIPMLYKSVKVNPEKGKEKEIAWQGTLQEAQRIAKESGAPVMLEFFHPQCAYCKKMAATTLLDSKVVQLSRKLVCSKLSIADKEASDLFDKLGFAGTPSIIFYSPEGKVLLKNESIIEAEALLALMYRALETTKD
jgi:thioredoxin-related protein